MRIATWNVNHWQRQHDGNRWDTVERRLREEGIDVALLQETGPIPDDDGVYHRLSRLRQDQDYRTGIVAINPSIRVEPIALEGSDGHISDGSLAQTHPGTLAAARITVDGERVVLASVHGRMYDAGNRTTYASTTMPESEPRD